MVDPLLGQRLDEYEIEAALGGGGMGRVYRARDTRRGHLAAVKVVGDTPQAAPDLRQRLECEAEAISALDHAHIVQFYKFAEAGGQAYLAMEYVEGLSLQAALASHDGQAAERPIGWAVYLAEVIGSALDHAHERGVLHRDVKPSNILIEAGTGRPVLTDFGLALLAPAGTQGQAFGSPDYMAPEQARSSAGAVPASDLYSLAVILYELITGQLPFVADSALGVALLHLQSVPPPASTLRPGLSPEVDAVLARALAKAPAERYPTGAALAAALAEAVGAAGALAAETAVASFAALIPAPVTDATAIRGQPAGISLAPDPTKPHRVRADPFWLAALVSLAALIGLIGWALAFPPNPPALAQIGYTTVAPSPAASEQSSTPDTPPTSGSTAPQPGSMPTLAMIGPLAPTPTLTPTRTIPAAVYAPPTQAAASEVPAADTAAPPPPADTLAPPPPANTPAPPPNTVAPAPTQAPALPSDTPAPPAPTVVADVVLCHSPGNSSRPRTITVEPGAVASHLGHGDTLGPCP